MIRMTVRSASYSATAGGSANRFRVMSEVA